MIFTWLLGPRDILRLQVQAAGSLRHASTFLRNVSVRLNPKYRVPRNVEAWCRPDRWICREPNAGVLQDCVADCRRRKSWRLRPERRGSNQVHQFLEELFYVRWHQRAGLMIYLWRRELKPDVWDQHTSVRIRVF